MDAYARHEAALDDAEEALKDKVLESLEIANHESSFTLCSTLNLLKEVCNMEEYVEGNYAKDALTDVIQHARNTQSQICKALRIQRERSMQRVLSMHTKARAIMKSVVDEKSRLHKRERSLTGIQTTPFYTKFLNYQECGICRSQVRKIRFCKPMNCVPLHALCVECADNIIMRSNNGKIKCPYCNCESEGIEMLRVQKTRIFISQWDGKRNRATNELMDNLTDDVIEAELGIVHEDDDEDGEVREDVLALDNQQQQLAQPQQPEERQAGQVVNREEEEDERLRLEQALDRDLRALLSEPIVIPDDSAPPTPTPSTSGEGRRRRIGTSRRPRIDQQESS